MSREEQVNKISNILPIVNKYLLIISCSTISFAYLMIFLIWFLSDFQSRDILVNIFLIFFVILIITLAVIDFKKKVNSSYLFDFLVWSGFSFYILMNAYSYFYDRSLGLFIKFIEGPFGGIMSVFIIAILLLLFYFFVFIYALKYVSDRYKRFFEIMYLLLGTLIIGLFFFSIENIANSEKTKNFLVPSIFLLYINYFLLKFDKNNFLKRKILNKGNEEQK